MNWDRQTTATQPLWLSARPGSAATWLLVPDYGSGEHDSDTLLAPARGRGGTAAWRFAGFGCWPWRLLHWLEQMGRLRHWICARSNARSRGFDQRDRYSKRSRDGSPGGEVASTRTKMWVNFVESDKGKCSRRRPAPFGIVGEVTRKAEQRPHELTCRIPVIPR